MSLTSVKEQAGRQWERVEPGELRPPSAPMVPDWVVETTGVTARTLVGWREAAWLTAPCGRRSNPAMPGSGRAFDWRSALDQIDWLSRLRAAGKVLDRVDAEAGWRLRHANVEWGARFAHNWVGFNDLATVAHLMSAAPVLSVIKVRVP